MSKKYIYVGILRKWKKFKKYKVLIIKVHSQYEEGYQGRVRKTKTLILNSLQIE